MKNIFITLLFIFIMACNVVPIKQQSAPPSDSIAKQTAQPEARLSQYETILVYTPPGYTAQFNEILSRQTHRDTAATRLFWYDINSQYATNGQLANIIDAMGDIFSLVNTGAPTFDQIKSEYTWAYSQPQVPGGLYINPLPDLQRNIVKFENDLKAAVQTLCDEKGFVIINDDRNKGDYYQQLRFQKK